MKVMEPDFESYLLDIHSKQYDGLDDDMVDDYDNWLQDLDVNDLIIYANEWGAKLMEGKK